jgi:ARG/rhodanese/phosphatase superfamily protein
MERSIFAAIFGGFLGILTLGGLAFVHAGPDFDSKSQPTTPPGSNSEPGSPCGLPNEPNTEATTACTLPPAPQPKPEGDWRILDPVTYENISVFPVVASYGQDTGAFLTLEEGLATGEVVVRERGSEEMVRGRDGRPVYIPQPTGASVNQLVLLNRSKRPLLLLAGELVSGGKQDRVIGKDRIVPVGAPPLPLDVFCVEHGRWTGSSQFAAALTIVHPSVRERAAVDQKQTEVWDAVRSGSTAAKPAAAPPARITTTELQSAIAGNAHTEAYEKIYQSSAVGVSIDDFVAEVQRRFAGATSGLKGERVVGVVVAYGGEIAWSDIFASGDLFDHYWHKLLRSYAVEALARPTVRTVASREGASEFLRRLNGRETMETEPGVYRWSEITEGHLAEIELEALQPKPMKLHRLLLHRTS